MGDPDFSSTIAKVQAALERLRLSVESRASRSDSPWVLVREGPNPNPSGSTSSEAQPLRGTRVQPDTYGDVLASFLPCPAHCLEICERLSPAGDLSASDRARRAWTAGCWAKAVIDNRVPIPRPTPVINLRPSVYIVLRCRLLPEPARFSSFRALRACVGPLEGSDTVCHSFPSIAEARVYCVAAGLAFPPAR